MTYFVDLLKCFILIAIALSNSAVVPLLDLLSIGESGRDALIHRIVFEGCLSGCCSIRDS